LAPEPQAFLLKIDGVIGPASSEYFHRGLAEAQEAKADLVILQIDTPGGLDTSMRAIIKEMLGSTIPIVVFVAPDGARAASAGTYIVYASHVAAMAPATNLGAATPVSLGGIPDLPSGENKKKEKDETPKDAMERKAINDAKAFLRSMAQLRGRNAEWAERAVASAESLSAEEALRQGVIEIVAKDLPDLLTQLNGREVQLQGQKIVLKTAEIKIRPIEPGWKILLLGILSNPNIAYILLILGIYGIIYEFSNPGTVLPGVVGAIFLILALYGLHMLPLNYTGLALIILGIALMVAEAFVPSFGALGIGGVGAFLMGSLILIETEIEGFKIYFPLIVSLTLLTAVVLIGLIGMAIKARRRKIVSGSEELIGARGEVLEDFNGTGQILLHGEIWQANSDRPLKKGQKVVVQSRAGLVVFVQPMDSETKEGSS
jgi:membrane-bound serine protease (ClpP class)